MLAIISDLHLTDGTCGSSLSPGVFEIFADRLRGMAIAASHRSDGLYRPIDRLDVLLLGDVLDLVRSARWNMHPKVRPWTDPQQPQFVELVTTITGDLLRHNDEALGILRKLTTAGNFTLPPADSLGRPVHGAAEVPVDVKIHYMVGNHDWMLHLSGPSYDLLRQAVVRHLGLCNRPDAPFPHDASESGELLDVLRRHRVLARHGDIFDPFNFEGHRGASSLGDAIVVELLNRFSLVIEQQLIDELPESALAGLRELDNVRPTLMAPIWIDGLLERACPLPSSRHRVKQIWDTLAEEFLELPFVRQRDTWAPNDLVDGLQAALKFSKRLSAGWAASILSFMQRMQGNAAASYAPFALAEQDFRNRRARHIVYGHTHTAESVPLDASFAESYVLNQVYFNSGTWRRLHRQTQLAPHEHEFIAADTMTMLAFYQGDERKGRAYETWSGTLAPSPNAAPVRRIDLGQPADASIQQVPAPAVRVGGPHFRPAASKRVVPTRRK